ncbi:MAG: dTDP-4-dehydrorhamnose reductase [Anaerolineae bacterium]
MRIVITGALGQLGSALQNALAGADLIPVDIPEWDITDPRSTPRLVELKPDVIIHCAAMTDVDGCARNPDLAYHVNAFGTQIVALACQRIGATMVHISTNEVFDGASSEPYREFDPPHPINPYGASKLAAEQIAARLVERLYIVRISWLFAPGRKNFVSKIISLADERGQLKVVDDEVANPTYAPDLADAIARLIQTEYYGNYHLVNEGYCSRYEFALEILKQSGRGGIPVSPITSDQFQRASSPPPFTPLRNSIGAALGITLRPWQEALADYFAVSVC